MRKDLPCKDETKNEQSHYIMHIGFTSLHTIKEVGLRR
jgi:hypothetical protein